MERTLDRVGRAGKGGGSLWAVALAGGAGIRLRPLVRRVCGDERPKQFAPLLGPRSLLRMTLDRLALAIPPERTVVVGDASHARYLAAEMAGGSLPRVLAQPADRGTAAAILLAAHWISWRDPEATIAVCPSDHLVNDEPEFMDHLLMVAAHVGEDPEQGVLVGAVPTAPETEYGWIEPGAPIGEVQGNPVCRVARFVEKPWIGDTRAFLASGWLWNTFVLIARVVPLLEVGWHALPQLSDWLARVEPFTDSRDEAWALRHAYRLAAPADFSRTVLETCSPFFAVSRLPATVHWSDLGTPRRVLASLRSLDLVPPWLSDAERAGLGIA